MCSADGHIAAWTADRKLSQRLLRCMDSVAAAAAAIAGPADGTVHSCVNAVAAAAGTVTTAETAAADKQVA